MNLAPMLSAHSVIQVHALFATIALVLGPFILFRKKGDARHKFLGRIWVAVMAVAVGSSWFISELPMLGRFSPIHIFSVMGTIALFQIIWFARNGNIPAHKAAAKGLYLGGLIVAGTFTFLPGRIMNEMIFGGPSAAGFYLILTIVLIGLAFNFISPRLGWRKSGPTTK